MFRGHAGPLYRVCEVIMRDRNHMTQHHLASNYQLSKWQAGLSLYYSSCYSWKSLTTLRIPLYHMSIQKSNTTVKILRIIWDLPSSLTVPTLCGTNQFNKASLYTCIWYIWSSSQPFYVQWSMKPRYSQDKGLFKWQNKKIPLSYGRSDQACLSVS